jgi:YggT family protein
MTEALVRILFTIAETILFLAMILFLIRLLLQAARADFYNPISQGILKATEPVLRPMRLVIPGFRNVDLASFVAALLVATLMVSLARGFRIPLGPSFLLGLYNTLSMILTIYWFGIIIVIVLSFLAPGSVHPAALLVRQVIEPILAPARRLLPPLGGLDLSPILVFLALYAARELLAALFRGFF